MDYNNYKFIILAILGIAIGYILYRYFFPGTGSQLIGGQIHILVQPPSIKMTTLTAANYVSKNISYSAWVYVNKFPANLTSPDTVSDVRYIFRLVDTGSKIYYGWYFDNTTLYVGYSSVSAGTIDQKKAVIANFPLQDWCYVTVVIDNTNKILNCYMNGKLTTSIAIQKYEGPSDLTNISEPIKFGTGQDIYLSNFTVINKVMNPDDVFNEYMKFASFTNSLGHAPFHFGFSISQNLNTQNYQLF